MRKGKDQSDTRVSRGAPGWVSVLPVETGAGTARREGRRRMSSSIRDVLSAGCLVTPRTCQAA